MLAEIQKISTGRIEYIVNTHGDAEHVGGNETFAKPRMDFLCDAGHGVGPRREDLAHENVLPRMSLPTDGRVPYPAVAWPNDTYSSAQRKIFFNDESIVITHAPAARTDGDSFVFFRRSDVISAGDLFVTTALSGGRARQSGGSLAGIISGLNQHPRPDGAALQPGGRHLCDSRARPRRRSARRARVPRHAGDRSRPDSQRRGQGPDARRRSRRRGRRSTTTRGGDPRQAHGRPTGSSKPCSPRARRRDDAIPSALLLAVLAAGGLAPRRPDRRHAQGAGAARHRRLLGVDRHARTGTGGW